MAGMTEAELQHGQDYIDESGWTSLEPEGAGHHPHGHGWQAVSEGIGVSSYTIGLQEPEMDFRDRWEGRRHDDFGGHPVPQRGMLPVEGDGAGGPE